MITRRDLSPGLQAAQAVHGAFAFAARFPAEASGWHENSNFLVVLAAQDETELASLLDRAARLDLARVAVREPDLGDELTAIVLEPGEAARRACSSLPLALKETAMT